MKVRPQHSASAGTKGVNPASRSTATVARPTCGEKWSVKESTKSATGWSVPAACAAEATRPSSAAQERKVCRAKVGMLRRGSTPAAGRVTRLSPGSEVSALATRGSFEATRASCGSRPSE